MRVIIGYLENLDFDDGAEIISEITGIDPRKVREEMSEILEKLFKKANILHSGSTANMRYPIGGYFFKMVVPPDVKDVKKFVLERFGLDASLTILFGKLAYFSVGIPIKEFLDDKYPHELSWCHDNTLDFAKHLAAFYRHRRERGREDGKPYLLIVDEKFCKEFPVDENLDST